MKKIEFLKIWLMLLILLTGCSGEYKGIKSGNYSLSYDYGNVQQCDLTIEKISGELNSVVKLYALVWEMHID